ncbi:MAG: glutamate 5-kinase [Pirellulaceae bacterium]|nr:MAG: glutamate 5-kinase [Pirellulaceae bacterium]
MSSRRDPYLNEATSLVVKVGSRVLSDAEGRLDHQQVANLSRQIAQIYDRGLPVILVSSGAVAAGMGKLGLVQRPTDVSHLQAVAAVGQAHLIQAYEQCFHRHGRHAAQVLLTADDLDDRPRYLNVRNTLLTLLSMGVVPVINENDTVAVDELIATFGDNDRLAAMVAGLLKRPLLVILSDVAGLYDRHPDDPQATVIETVEQIDSKTMELATPHRSSVSKGGMASKLRAARLAVRSGSPAIIAGGRTPDVLLRIVAGEPLGTFFVPQARGLPPRKRWIGFTAQVAGTIVVDDGAAAALRRAGPSLLAIGIREVRGSFHKGDVVAVCDSSGCECARGLTNYSSDELAKIRGLRSPEIAQVLGHCPYEEVIHRDNMVLSD